MTTFSSRVAQPSSTRNHSSLALRLSGMFGCSIIQKSSVKVGKIQKIFITHTHGERPYIRVIPLLAMRLNGAGGMVDGAEDPRTSTATPWELCRSTASGTRAYVRAGLLYTHTLLGAPYAVHELRLASDPPEGDHTALPPHVMERPGRNIVQDAEGAWPEIFADPLVTVSAAPILHSVPCVGFVVAERPIPGKMDPKKYLQELKRTGTPMSVMSQLQRGEAVTLKDGTVLRGPERQPGRKIVILGDTYDPSPIARLAEDACLLIHEATNAHLPGVDPSTKTEDTYLSVEERTKSRGHSTPQMAGVFGKRIRARKLLLNHFSARYAGDVDTNEESRKIMDAIRGLAESTFEGEVVCATDLMSVDVRPRRD
ncbi:Metallo-hydrolase/oxidoreductase [Epithele typhae]|uniref:Metallo-hydrolase/oxidoreductase n=1 Tax=Epithele typhae TaxID=378194 RepID=UPI0020087437|nr:Metallo-hydrolase/oxidoreductase [Epithele typhae]KAH9943160.1 Metallo-hydrolase/oxidoreductase [Epithele typhae]